MRIHITDLNTGKTIYNAYAESSFAVWPTIEEYCAEWYNSFKDDVGILETEDGDQIGIKGQPVARIDQIWS